MKTPFSGRKRALQNGQQPRRRPLDRERLKRAALSVMLVLNVIMFAGFCVLMIRTNRKISEVNYQMSYLSDTTSVLLGNISTMKSDIESTLEEESSLLESWQIRLEDMNFAENTYRVQIEIVPKKYSETTEASIYFGTKYFPLEMDGYQFTGIADLTLDEAYDGNVTVLFTEGKSRETEVISSYSDVRTDLTQVLAGVLYDDPVYADGQLDMNVNGYLRLDGGSFFVFDHLYMVVEADDTVVKAYDLASMASGTQQAEAETETGQSFLDTLLDDDGEAAQDAEAVYETPDQEAAAKADENLPLQTDELTWLAYSYSLQDSIGLNPGCHVRVYLKAVSENGFTFTYDLFGADIKAGSLEEDGNDAENAAAADNNGSAGKTDTAALPDSTADNEAAGQTIQAEDSNANAQSVTSGQRTSDSTDAAAGNQADTASAAADGTAPTEGYIDENSIDLTAHAVVYDSHGGNYVLD